MQLRIFWMAKFDLLSTCELYYLVIIIFQTPTLPYLFIYGYTPQIVANLYKTLYII